MGKITHTTLIFTDLSKLQEIPSEFIEPYLATFMSYIIESVACGWKTPAEARADLIGVERFISLFGGLHSRIATSNKYRDFCDMTDEAIIEICKDVCKEP